MGYLDNSSITVDAILTKRGRELLAQSHRMDPNDVNNRFKITQFALGDDEIDYSLFNENHPNGTQFAGEAIENMAIIEAFPDGNNIMKHKLITLDKGTSKLPVLTINTGIINMTIGGSTFIQPQTLNFDGANNQVEVSGYRFTVQDNRLLSGMSAVSSAKSGKSGATTGPISSFESGLSRTVAGSNSITLNAINSTSLFGTNDTLTTTLTIEGLDSGARITIPLKVTRVIATTDGVAENQARVSPASI